MDRDEEQRVLDWLATRETDMVALIADLEALTQCSGGPVGGKAHSGDECLDLTSIAPRARALALTITQLRQGG